MKYPDNERILIVRPCLKAICLGVRSASKLLSVVLYRARNCADDETAYTFTCTQTDLVHDLCEELTTKQLHDMAIPVLQLLGYLEVNGSGFRHTYTVHLDRVQEALSCYRNKEELELLLISFIHKELEEVPMELELVPIQLEEVLNHLELLLKTIGTSSKCKRGRKPRQEAHLEGNSENTDSNRDITDNRDKERDGFAPHTFLPSENSSSEEGDPTPTVRRMPVIKLNGANQNGHHPTTDLQHSRDSGLDALRRDVPAHGNRASIEQTPSFSHVPDAASVFPPPKPQPGAPKPQDKPKRTRKKPLEVQLTLHEQEVKEWYEELRGVEVSFSKKNVTALQALGKRTMTKDDFLNVTAILDGDTWFEEHKIGVDLYWIERQWENKIIFLQRKKPPLADKKPLDVYTAASLDPERNKRNLERLKANRLAKEAAQGVSHGTN